MPVVVAFVLAALWIAGAPPNVPDLRLSAPIVARPGSSIGLRAWQVDRDDDGYTVVRAPVAEVELRNASGMRVAGIALVESHVHGREGTLEIPPDVNGEMTLMARATIGGREVGVERTLYVRDGIDSKLPKGRAVNAFQAYELEPIRVIDAARAPPMLDPRIEEGVCVPDLRCTLIVWTDAWSGRARVRSRVGVEVERSVSAVEDQFARFPLRVRGQEGLVVVEALAEDGTVTASRNVRLPLVPGGLVARASFRESALSLEWESLGGEEPVLVDVFADHRWVRAFSLSPENPGAERLPPGVWRIQARADIFSDNTAGVAHVAVPAAGGAQPLRAAAEAVMKTADREGLDPLAAAILDGSFSGSQSDAMRALFAVPSFGVVAVGPGVSARIGIDEAVAREQDVRRWQAAGVILLLGFVVSMILFRVEVVAYARASAFLDDLGGEDSRPRRSPPTERGLWAFVLLVFVLIAVLALSKRWF